MTDSKEGLNETQSSFCGENDALGSSLNTPTGLCSAVALAGRRLNNTLLLLWPQDYDDGYGTAYDDQGYESYDNSYNNQGQK